MRCLPEAFSQHSLLLASRAGDEAASAAQIAALPLRRAIGERLGECGPNATFREQSGLGWHLSEAASLRWGALLVKWVEETSVTGSREGALLHAR